MADLVTAIDAGKSPPAADAPWEPGKQFVLKVSAVAPGGFRKSEIKVVLEGHQMATGTLVRSGDFLLTRANTSERVGWACIVDEVLAETYLSDKTLRLHVDAEMIHPELLVHLLDSPAVRVQIQASATGSSASMKNISQAKLRRVVVPVPAPGQQSVLLARLRELAGLATRFDGAIRSVREVRRLLLARSIEGRGQ